MLALLQQHRTCFKALKAAEQIVTQHNLNSTATRQERSDTIARFIEWWNQQAVPLIDTLENTASQ